MHKPQLSHDISSPPSNATISPPSVLSTSAPASSRLHIPSRPFLPTRHTPSPSLNNVFSAAHLPRTSSLLPPPNITAASQANPSSTARDASPVAAPSAPPQTPPRSSATAGQTSPSHESLWNLNRWSASTGSSRASLLTQRAPASRFGLRASTNANTTLNLSPPSTGQSPRKLQKTRRPSTSSPYKGDTSSVPALPWEAAQTTPGLPPIVPLPSLEHTVSTEYSQIPPEGADSGPIEHRPAGDAQQLAKSGLYLDTGEFSNQSTVPSLRPGSAATNRTLMPYDQGPNAYQPRGHSRSRSGKGSNELKGRATKPPSQKAMLSRALQKANTAVQLDNALNFEGARQAYAEACHLLQQVLHRTTGEDDQRKLEAIRRTYTSRIEELDEMAPWQDEEDTKALPARPDSDIHRPDSVLHLDDEVDDDEVVIGTATVTRIINEDDHSPQPPYIDPYHNQHNHHHSDYHHHHYQQQQEQDLLQRRRSLQDKLRPIVTTLAPEPGLLQSSFSRSPIRLRATDNLVLQRPNDSPYMPAPLSPRPPPSPVKADDEDQEEPIRTDISLYTGYPNEPRDTNHIREDSLNSWLDPIDESGGSSSSSVHSRTSSLNIRRKHIRAASGDTEAEFDTALDAAIEAAYDDGYEPMDADDYVTGIANQYMPRESVLTEQELVQEPWSPGMPDFYDDNSSDEEERILEEMTRDHGITQLNMDQSQQTSVPRESDSSGLTSRTWHSSTGSNPPTVATSLPTVTEVPPATHISKISAPAAPPPTQSLPELPQRPGSSAQSVRNRRLSGQNPKQLKIETTKLPSTRLHHRGDSAQSRSAASNGQETDTGSASVPRSTGGLRRPSSPHHEVSPTDIRLQPSPFGYLGPAEGDDNLVARSASPSTTKLRKNFSSSSLRSVKSRNMSVSNLEEGSDMSPGTPSSNHFGSVRPAVPAIPTPISAAFRDKLDGMHLFDDSILSPNGPGSPSAISADAPVPLEPCPTDFMLRPFWLMRCLYQTLAHPRGGYLSNKLFVPRDVWRVKGVKLKNIEDKIANCDFLTAALLKIAKVDTCDADAVLEEMQSLEGVLEQVQSALSRKLGNEVGVQGSGALFKDASTAADENGSTGVPRSSSVSGKSSSFSWRRLRSKNSAVGLGGSYNSRLTGHENGRDVPSIPTLPMTPNPTSRPAKRDVSQVQFTGPNAMYMNALARLFDAAQAIDQIARQVEDPGLRHADKTQVGLELCTRHAAEFFGFYVCRFVLADISLLLDKFIKRGSEWVLS